MPARTVAVFGSSEPRDGEILYAVARDVGREIARAGYAVATGGYGGVMEAACRGAREAGGETIGVTCSIFDRSPNGFLTREIATADLHERQRTLVDVATAYVVLPGKSGTLSELTLVWALRRAGSLDRRPVVLLGAGWRAILQVLLRYEMLEAEQLETTRVVDTPVEAVEAIDAYLAAEG